MDPAGTCSVTYYLDSRSHRTERESEKMMALAKEPDNTVLLFEIGGTYSLGRDNNRYLSHLLQPVHDKDKMLSAGLNVLISK